METVARVGKKTTRGIVQALSCLLWEAQDEVNEAYNLATDDGGHLDLTLKVRLVQAKNGGVYYVTDLSFVKGVRVKRTGDDGTVDEQQQDLFPENDEPRLDFHERVKIFMDDNSCRLLESCKEDGGCTYGSESGCIHPDHPKNEGSTHA